MPSIFDKNGRHFVHVKANDERGAKRPKRASIFIVQILFDRPKMKITKNQISFFILKKYLKIRTTFYWKNIQIWKSEISIQF